MSMYFLDETDDWPEYKAVRDEIRRLENQHAGLMRELKKAESLCTSDSGNKGLKAEVDELKNRLKEIEEKLDASLSMYR